MSSTAFGPQPLTALVSKYGVSAVAIGKTCRKLQIPLLGREYCAKKAHGHPVERKPLPKLHEVPRIVRYQRPTVTSPKSSPPAKPEFPVEEEDKADIAHIDQLLSAGVFVVKKPRKALRHPLVVAARNILRHSYARRQLLEAPWNEPCLDINISKASLRRALEVMAAIIAILEANGVTVRVTPGDRSRGGRPHETSGTIFGERILFGVTEKTRQVRVPDPTPTPDASVRLRYSIHYEAHRRAGHRGVLENGANSWHRARRIREYVLALVECRKKQGKELGPDTALGKWVTWALQQPDRIDPLAESPASVLDRKRELEGWSAPPMTERDSCPRSYPRYAKPSSPEPKREKGSPHPSREKKLDLQERIFALIEGHPPETLLVNAIHPTVDFIQCLRFWANKHLN